MRKTKLQEFLTPKRALVLQKKNGRTARQYTLGYFTLDVQSIVYMEFATDENPNGVENLTNRLSNNDPMACLKTLYLLIEDKEDFPLFEDFTKKLDKYNVPMHEMMILLTKIINDSIPSLRKKKLMLNLAMTTIVMIFAGLLYSI